MESKRSIRKGIKRNLIKSITVESDMGKVWTFGDSLTERYNPTFKWSREYIQWKGYLPKVYGNFLSEKLGYELENMGKAGCDNYTIFETFCNTYPLMGDDDVIVIGWTSCLRFRLVDRMDNWITLHPNFDNYLNNFEHISNTTIDEMMINRKSQKYNNEVNNWIRFIQAVCKEKRIIHWSALNGRRGELDGFHFFDLERINVETNGLIDDSHFSESGHERMADELIDIIRTNRTKNKLI